MKEKKMKFEEDIFTRVQNYDKSKESQRYLKGGLYPREGPNVSEEGGGVSKDLEGRPPPRLICRLSDSCLAGGGHHGSEVGCHHPIGIIVIPSFDVFIRKVFYC